MQGTLFQIPGSGRSPGEMFLPGKSYGLTEEPRGLQSMAEAEAGVGVGGVSKGLDTT